MARGAHRAADRVMDVANLQSSVGLLHLFGDPTRVRLMALLEREELTVAELVGITELSQSRVSTHLGKLRDAGLLRDRRQGSSTYYRVNDGAMPAEARRLWALLREQIKDAVLESDRGRCEALLAARAGDQAWPDAIAGQMERHYSPGRTWEAMARGLVGLLRLGDVLDVGCGDGYLGTLLGPRARSYTGLDRSPKVLAAAERRLANEPHATVRSGDMHALPFVAGSFDDVMLFHVLTYAEDPERVVAEAARVLRPGGRVVVVTLACHTHADVTCRYGHVNDGFAPKALARMLAREGLDVSQCEVTSRERRDPHFEVVTAVAQSPSGTTR